MCVARVTNGFLHNKQVSSQGDERSRWSGDDHPQSHAPRFAISRSLWSITRLARSYKRSHFSGKIFVFHTQLFLSRVRRGHFHFTVTLSQYRSQIIFGQRRHKKSRKDTSSVWSINMLMLRQTKIYHLYVKFFLNSDGLYCNHKGGSTPLHSDGLYCNHKGGSTPSQVPAERHRLSETRNITSTDHQLRL